MPQHATTARGHYIHPSREGSRYVELIRSTASPKTRLSSDPACFIIFALQLPPSGLAQTDTMSEQYQYRDLPTKSTVRLIKLEKRKVQDRIACTIRYTEQFIGEYDALSYVWGSPVPTRQIFIFNEDAQEWAYFYVHENMWQFLNSIWQRHIFNRWLWTDRICLNQNNKEEKKEQIPRMADIYHNAVRVVASLGLSASQGEHLLPVCDFIHRNKFILGKVDWHAKFTAEAALAGKAVLEAEYWERIWVVQEVVSAKTVFCFIGNMDMAFDEVWELRNFGHDPKCWSHRVLRAGNSFEDVGGTGVILWRFLKNVTCKGSKSQRPHDRVYAILGLVATLSHDKSPLEHIEIDYDKAPADVFLDAILEAYPEWEHHYDLNYSNAIELLLPDNTTTSEPIFTFLTRYSESIRTSQRHSELAKLVLSVSDALYLIAFISGSPPGGSSTRRAFHKLLPNIESAVRSGKLKRTTHMSAVMLGVAIAFEVNDEEKRSNMFGDWKACRLSRVQANPPWRCATHQSLAPLCARSRSQEIDRLNPDDQGVLQTITGECIECYHAIKSKQSARRGWDFQCSMGVHWTLGSQAPPLKVCGACKDIQGSRPRGCSFVSCEFPEARFRLRVSFHESPDDCWGAEQIDLLFSPDFH